MNIMSRLGTGKQNSSQIKQRLGIRPMQQNGSGPAFEKGDARLKLIQKKRLNITDARDRLAQLAKQGDARTKLNMKKQQQAFIKGSATGTFPKGNPMRNRVNPQQIPSLKAVVARNGRSNFPKSTSNSFAVPSTGLRGKTIMKAGSLMRTVGGVQKMRPVSQPIVRKASDINAERYHPLPNNPNVVTIRNERMVPIPKVPNNSRYTYPQLKAKRYQQTASSPPSVQSLPARRTIPNPPIMKPFRGNVWEPFSVNNPLNQEIKPTRLKITTTNSNYMDYDIPDEKDMYRPHAAPPPRVPAFKRPAYEGYNEYMPPVPKKPVVLSSNMISRLDQQPQRQSSFGFKVLVSNLHHVVTVEDVEELFMNIGPIKNARILRDGVAEVVFANEEDAYRSVEVYNNRQLDGQAMNVTFMAKKAPMPTYVTSSAPTRYTAPPQAPVSRYSLSPSPPRPQPSQSYRKPSASNSLSMAHHHQSSLKPVPGRHMTKSVLRTAGTAMEYYLPRMWSSGPPVASWNVRT